MRTWEPNVHSSTLATCCGGQQGQREGQRTSYSVSGARQLRRTGDSLPMYLEPCMLSAVE